MVHHFLLFPSWSPVLLAHILLCECFYRHPPFLCVLPVKKWSWGLCWTTEKTPQIDQLAYIILALCCFCCGGAALDGRQALFAAHSPAGGAVRSDEHCGSCSRPQLQCPWRHLVLKVLFAKVLAAEVREACGHPLHAGPLNLLLPLAELIWILWEPKQSHPIFDSFATSVGHAVVGHLKSGTIRFSELHAQAWVQWWVSGVFPMNENPCYKNHISNPRVLCPVISERTFYFTDKALRSWFSKHCNLSFHK